MKCSQGSTRIQKLVWSFCKDLIYGATNGKIMTSNHILLYWAVKTLTGNVEVIKIMNRLGHGISYSKLEEIDTALCLQKSQVHGMSAVAIPSNILSCIPAVLAFDNIDRQEETLSGSGTSHRVNGIIVQPQVATAQLPPDRPKMVKDKRRSIPPQNFMLPHYDYSGRRSPPPVSPLSATAVE